MNLSELINPLSANPTKWSNTFKQFLDKLPTNCLSVFDDFVKMALKALKKSGLIFSGTKRNVSLSENIFIITESYRSIPTLVSDMPSGSIRLLII